MTAPRKLDLAAIRVRAEKATEGPWTAWNDGAGSPMHVIAGEMKRLGPIKQADWLAKFDRQDQDDGPSEADIANAEFTAAAREDVPALLRAVEVLSAELRRLREVVGEQDTEAIDKALARAGLEGR